MKGSAKRKCLCCCDFFASDRRNVRHQRYCSKPACRRESKALSQRRWLQSPENQNYFRGPENRQLVKDWAQIQSRYWGLTQAEQSRGGEIRPCCRTPKNVADFLG